MAKDKKSFILYSDYLQTFEDLTDEEAGKLIKHVLRYVNDLNPQTDDRILNLAFSPIKRQLKRDLKDWEEERKKRSEAGKAAMAKRWHKTDIKSITSDNTVIKTITNITDNVNATVTDNVNAIAAEQVFEFLRRAAPVSIQDDQIWIEVGKIISQYKGVKVGNLQALCNSWASRMEPIKKQMVM